MSKMSRPVNERAEYDRPPSSLLSGPGPVPSYSSLPRPEEETVQYTRRHRPSDPPSDGTYRKSWESLTLILHDQPASSGSGNGAARPTYDHHNHVAGEIELKRPQNVLSIVIKLEGKVVIASSGIGAEVISTVSEEVRLWSRDGSDCQRCPGILAFSLRLPRFFSRDGELWMLPPSFEPEIMAATFVRSMYTLTVELARTIKCYVVSWENVKTYDLRINYMPKSRTSQPIPQFDSVQSIKSSPNEWKQHVSTMKTKDGSSLRPVDCHFLVPAKYTHALSDSIPFHIQLSSTLDTLKELLPPNDLRTKRATRKQGMSAIRVYIARQIIMEIHGKMSSQTINIGSGTMRPVPPDFSDGEERPKYPCLDWEGEVKCSEKIKTGGFDIGTLNVRDFVVLVLSPPTNKGENSASALLPMQIAHPVKFVTNAWLESDTLHPQDD